MKTTTNYQLKTFDTTDPVDLTYYNDSMTKIDTELKSVSDKATQASDNSFVTAPGDAGLTVADLKRLKVTDAGIVYLPQE